MQAYRTHVPYHTPMTHATVFVAAGAQALGIALKLTFQGDNQLLFGETYVCIMVSGRGACACGAPVESGRNAKHTTRGLHGGNLDTQRRAGQCRGAACTGILLSGSRARARCLPCAGTQGQAARPRTLRRDANTGLLVAAQAALPPPCAAACSPRLWLTPGSTPWFPCLQVVVACVMTQMNYLNKALDLFNTAIVSPVYYVMFTLLTILASIIMFRVRAGIAWDACACQHSCGRSAVLAGGLSFCECRAYLADGEDKKTR